MWLWRTREENLKHLENMGATPENLTFKVWCKSGAAESFTAVTGYGTVTIGWDKLLEVAQKGS